LLFLKVRKTIERVEKKKREKVALSLGKSSS
jgi:hypothetical protein